MTFLPLAADGTYFGLSSKTILAILAVLAVIVLIISKVMSSRKKSSEASAESTNEAPSDAVASTEALPEVAEAQTDGEEDEIPHIPGYVVLDGVSEQDAAVLMAIISHKTGIDLTRLDFKSIKRLNQDPLLINIEEQDAAAIMAITSDKTGIPLDRLMFNSIKLVED